MYKIAWNSLSNCLARCKQHVGHRGCQYIIILQGKGMKNRLFLAKTHFFGSSFFKVNLASARCGYSVKKQNRVEQKDPPIKVKDLVWTTHSKQLVCFWCCAQNDSKVTFICPSAELTWVSTQTSGYTKVTLDNVFNLYSNSKQKKVNSTQHFGT